MNFKRLFLPLIFLVMAMASVNATLTVSTGVPASGQTFYPNLVQSDKCVDINFLVTDDNAQAPIKTVTIFYNYKDGNTYVVTDLNLSVNTGGYCVGDVDWSAGAACKVNYCWADDKPANGGRVLDINVSAGHDANVATGSTKISRYASTESLTNFTIDNRYISTSVQGLVNTIPLVLVGIILAVIAAALLGYVGPKIAMVLLPGLIITLIALVVIAQFVLTLVGQ